MPNKIAESSRDNNATGTRQEIIRKEIRNRLEKEFPALFSSIKNESVQKSVSKLKSNN